MDIALTTTTSNTTLQEERETTINNIGIDIFKLETALESVSDLTPEGEIIREDLLGLLYFNSDSYHQVDALMNERKKVERKKSPPKKKIIFH